MHPLVAQHLPGVRRLCEALEQTLGRPVHVVERIAIDNPYFERAFEQTRVPVYDAA